MIPKLPPGNFRRRKLLTSNIEKTLDIALGPVLDWGYTQTKGKTMFDFDVDVDMTEVEAEVGMDTDAWIAAMLS